MVENFDVIVVGSGVSGALVAWKLAQKKLKVLVLESGERGAARLDLIQNYAIAQRKSPHAPYKSAENDSKSPSADGPTDYYDQQTTDPKNQYLSGYERRVGGTTSHWLGHTPRLLPNDFRIQTAYGVGVDWPITYAELEPWYCQAELELGVAGDHDEWNNLLGAFRSRAFPMSKIWPSYSDLKVQEAIAEAELEFDGVPLRVFSMPSARNSQPYDGRPACAGNSICVPICPIQAKYDATVHVIKAEKAGAVVREKSVVTRLEVGEGGKVQQVIYKTWDNQDVSVKARIVVLAANAIETPKLLLMSGPAVANSSDQVGRNLMDHLQQTALADCPEPLFPFRGPPSVSGIDVLRDGDFRRTRSAFRISFGNDGRSKQNYPYQAVLNSVNDGNLFGAELKKQVAEQVSRQLRLSCSTEVLPNPANRVTLSNTKFDGLGLAVPRIEFKVDGYTRAGLLEARKAMSLIFEAMKVTASEFFERDPENYSGAGHIMGTCRMGSDEKQSVVNADCRSHDNPNLFIVGSSVFSTCGTANPTLTIAALALRAAETIRLQLTQHTT